jgi:hypothetical protein
MSRGGMVKVGTLTYGSPAQALEHIASCLRDLEVNLSHRFGTQTRPGARKAAR